MKETSTPKNTFLSILPTHNTSFYFHRTKLLINSLPDHSLSLSPPFSLHFRFPLFNTIRTVSHDSIALIDDTIGSLEGGDLSSGVLGGIRIRNLEVDAIVLGGDERLVEVCVLVSVDLEHHGVYVKEGTKGRCR